MSTSEPLTFHLDQKYDDEVVDRGPLQVVPAQYIATLDGERLPLTRREFELLVLFVRNPGRLLRRDRIAADVWDSDSPGRTIDIHVARLRSRLPKGAIETVIRVGYRFVLQ
ncbi:MAG: two-component system, OmpR family, alkaline phosphatase synthesis response regulator PhoP [Actinomycetota bacterium]|jgi:DNA-binding response OmpR family regulator|nr:two-component system, OmpR family, alkaline phosphatase synthesis response regulator PhoP [Actinomycetota bacterium]